MTDIEKSQSHRKALASSIEAAKGTGEDKSQTADDRDPTEQEKLAAAEQQGMIGEPEKERGPLGQGKELARLMQQTAAEKPKEPPCEGLVIAGPFAVLEEDVNAIKGELSGEKPLFGADDEGKLAQAAAQKQAEAEKAKYTGCDPTDPGMHN